jgi:hypothetical protein
MFYDEGMWKTKAGGGPCGFVYAPEEVEPPRATVGPYSVAVHLRTQPEVRRITVGMWDFTTTPDVAAVRSYLRSGGEGISDDVAAQAKTDWLAGVARPAQLPAPRRDELTQLVAEHRKPTPYDTMTAEIATPHVTWAKPLPDGPVRTLVVTRGVHFASVVRRLASTMIWDSAHRVGVAANAEAASSTERRIAAGIEITGNSHAKAD